MASTSSLFDQSNVVPFAGATYDAARDEKRLMTQLQCILALTLDNRWYTIQKLVCDLRKQWPDVSFPENSVQAQLRNLRKIGYIVERRNVAQTGCLFEYRVLSPINPGVGDAMRKAAA